MPVPFDAVCLSRLPGEFVSQRTQHLLTRRARERRVFSVEEPLFDADTPCIDARVRS